MSDINRSMFSDDIRKVQEAKIRADRDTAIATAKAAHEPARLLAEAKLIETKAAHVTEIRTDDMFVNLPPPWPEGYIGGELCIDGDEERTYLGSGFVGPDGPAEKTVSRGWVFDEVGRVRVPLEGGGAFGPWPTLEAARQAAWAHVAASEVIERARRLEPIIVEAQRLAREEDVAEAAKREARRRRAGELHRCAACQTTFHGDDRPAIVIRAQDRIEIEDDEGAVAFEGTADEVAVKIGGAVAASVVTRAKQEIEGMGKEAERLVDRALVTGEGIGARGIGAVLGVFMLHTLAKHYVGVALEVTPVTLGIAGGFVLLTVLTPLAAAPKHRRRAWLAMTPAGVFAVLFGAWWVCWAVAP